MGRVIPLSLGWRVAGGLALAAALYAGHAWDKRQAVHAAHAGGMAQVQARWDAERIEQQALALLAEQQARATEQARIKAAQEAMDGYRKKAAAAAADAGRARTERDRLLDVLAAREAAAARDRQASSDPGAAPGPDDPAAERDVLRSCSAAFSEMAADADAVAARLSGLQEWVRGVMAAP